MAISPADKLSTELLIFHRKLLTSYCEKKSNATNDYNCIAFVFGITNQRWQPLPEQGDYWPDDIPNENTEEEVAQLASSWKMFLHKRDDAVAEVGRDVARTVTP